MDRKNKRRMLPVLGLLLTSAALLLGSCGKQDFSLSVVLTGDDGCTLEGESLTKVPYGENVSYGVALEDGRKIVQVLADGEPLPKYSYKKGVLTVKNITEPKTLQVVTGIPDARHIFLADTNTIKGGGVRSTIPQGYVADGSVSTLTAVPNDKAVFLGWSYDIPVNRGGEIVSTDEQITVKVTGDITVYANYDSSAVEAKKKKTYTPVSYTRPAGEDVITVIYYGEGGVTSDGSDKYADDFCFDYLTMLNTLPDTGLFTREGYVLTGYTTEEGGTEVYAPGYKLSRPEGEVVSLYCVWHEAEPESSFTSTENEGRVTVTGYTGMSGEVYIPRTIGGKPVTAIGENAFRGNETVTSVILPQTCYAVMNGAFCDCPNLTKFTMFDSMRRIGDECFEGTTLHTLALYAGTPPRYANSDLSFGKKYERLYADDTRGRVIVVSGSSNHYGFNSAMAEELLGGKYTVVNYGTNAQMNVMFFLDAISHLVGEGDTVVFCPEQYGPYCDTVNGNPEMTSLTYQGIESSYNLLPLVDISLYTKVFDTYAEYAATRGNMNAGEYDTPCYGINSYGDCSVPRPNYNSDGFVYGANGTFHFAKGTIPEEFLDNINPILDRVTSSGAKALFSYPPYNINACDDTQMNRASYDEYNEDMKASVHAALISDVADYFMPGKYFFNTDYHPMDEGRDIHTKTLCDDLIKAGC